MSWYFTSSGHEFGPVDASHVEALIRSGEIDGESMVRPSSDDHWTPIADSPAFAALRDDLFPTKSTDDNTRSLADRVANLLGHDEVVVHTSQLHPLLFKLPAVVAACVILVVTVCVAIETALLNMGAGVIALATCIAFAATSILFAVILLNAYIGVYFSKYLVTNRRVIRLGGWYFRRCTDLQLSRIESIHIIQGPIARYFDYGNVRLRTTGGGRPRFTNVQSPEAFRRAIREQMASSRDAAEPRKPAENVVVPMPAK